ncbi:hypothetical protein [Psychrobacillus psychrodurans]|uniref:hypothetical protein n=1 Tax=Psychrobacillus psychrodurans TaxID=126157 RepID=UPI003CFF152B
MVNLDKYLKRLEQQQKMVDRIAGGNTILERLEQQQKMVDRIAGGSTILERLEQQQKMVDRIAGGNTILERLEQQQKMVDRIAGGNTILERLEQQQKMVDRIAGGNTILERLEQQQKMVDRIAGGNTILERLEQQQKMVDRIAGGNTILERLEQQQKMVDRIAGGNTILERLEQQQKMVEKLIISPIIQTFKADTFQFSDGIAIVDNFFEQVHSDLESQEVDSSSQNNQELKEWLIEFLENSIELINILKKVCNTIDTKKAKTHLITLISLVGSILTIISFLQGNATEIYIHNEYEDVKIEIESSGDKTDIYIKKKDSTTEEEQVNEDKWLSGGERT